MDRPIVYNRKRRGLLKPESNDGSLTTNSVFPNEGA